MPLTLAQRTGVAPTVAAATGDALVSAVAHLSKDDLRARMHEALRIKTAAEGDFAVCLAESLKREMFLDDGATSPEVWTAECFGVSGPTARSYAQVAQQSDELPELMG